jgi:hypothetical protein
MHLGNLGYDKGFHPTMETTPGGGPLGYWGVAKR